MAKCVLCSYDANPIALVFHHLRDKKYTLHQLRNKGWERITKELDKCEALCANCHTILHSKTPVDF